MAFSGYSILMLNPTYDLELSRSTIRCSDYECAASQAAYSLNRGVPLGGPPTGRVCPPRAA